MSKKVFFLLLIGLIGLVLIMTADSLYAAAGVTIPSGATINVNAGTFTVAGSIAISGTLQTSSGSIALTGDWTNSGSFTCGTGTVTFNGSSAQEINTGGTGAGKLFNNVVVSNNFVLSGAYLGTNDMDVDGNFTISSSSYFTNPNNLSMTVAGNWSNSGSFTCGTGTVTMDGTTSATLTDGSAATTFYNLTIGNGTDEKTVTLNDFSEVTGTALTVTDNANLKTTHVSATPLPTFTTKTLSSESTIEFGASGNQTIPYNWPSGALNPYSNVWISGSGTKTIGSGNLNIDTDLSISLGAALDASTYNISCGGDWINDGTFTCNSGTVTFDGSSAQAITTGDVGPPFNPFYNVVIANTNGGGARLADGYIANIDGDFTINSGSYFTNPYDQNIVLEGDWTNNGSFTAGSGTVSISGSGTSIISGTTTFFDFACSTDASSAAKTLSFQADTTANGNPRTTITHNLTLNGTAEYGLTLNRYGGSGYEQWTIEPSSSFTRSVDYVTVSDSYNHDITYISVVHYTDSGNNTNWFSSASSVSLVSFYAVGYFGEVVINWKTATEYNNAGFNVYAGDSKDGPYTKLNAELIPGLGTATMGKEYSFTHKPVEDGKTYYYKLEDVEFKGRTRMHGPVSAHPGVDSDGDGMTDDWENHYGFNPNVNDSALDSDGDGVTNLDEFLEHTNPNVNEKETPGNEDALRIIESNASHIVIELITKSFVIEDIINNGKVYKLITIPDYTHGYTSETGSPKLPIKGVLLGIPQGVEAEKAGVSFDVEKYKGYNIYPVPAIAQKTSPADVDPINYLAEQFIINEEVYSKNKNYPADIVDVSYSGYLRSQNVANVRFTPFQINPVTGILLFYPRIRVEIKFTDKAKDKEGGDKAEILPVKESQGIKVFTKEEGLYRITYNDLYNAGFSSLSEIDPKTLKIYNIGKEIPVIVTGEEDASFDPEDELVFFAEKIDTKYSNANVYWIYYGGKEGLRMEKAVSGAFEPLETPGKFLRSVNFEEDKLYWPDINGGEDADHWFFDAFMCGRREYYFNIDLNNPSIDPDCRIKFKCVLRGIFDYPPYPNHHTQVYINNNLLDDAYWSGLTEHTVELTDIPQAYLIQGANTIKVKILLDTGAKYDFVLADYFRIEYWNEFTAEDDCFGFGYTGNGVYRFDIAGFTNRDAEIFDVTDPENVKQLIGFTTDDEYNVSFRDLLNGEKKYLALTKDKMKTPERMELDVQSELKSRENQADYIIITADEFYYDVLPLAYLRESLGLKTIVVKVDDIYDEFNYGIKSAHAIKEFLKYAYNDWLGPPPTYVLLVGDASYDPKDNMGLEKSDFVPTYFKWFYYTGQTGIDSWFVTLDGEDDLLPDMFIGRIPVRTYQDIQVVVDKIMRYELDVRAGEEWTNKAIFVADNEEIKFERMCEELKKLLPDGFSSTSLYLNSYDNPFMLTQDIIENVNNGALILTYAGHGGIDLWADEDILNIDTIDLFSNSYKLPFLVSLTCEDGFYLHPFIYDCMAETFLRKEGGGAIAVFAATSATLSDGQTALAKGLYESVFTNKNIIAGAATTMAKISLFSQCGTIYSGLLKTYTLFGDPALRLKLDIAKEATVPDIQPVTEINDNDKSEQTGEEPNVSSSGNTADSEGQKPISGFESIYRSEIKNYESSKEWRDVTKTETVTYKLYNEEKDEKEEKEIKPAVVERKDEAISADDKEETHATSSTIKDQPLTDEYEGESAGKTQKAVSKGHANNAGIAKNLQAFDYLPAQELIRNPTEKTIAEPIIKTENTVIKNQTARASSFKPEMLNIDRLFSKIGRALHDIQWSKLQFTVWERVRGFIKSVFSAFTKRK